MSENLTLDNGRRGRTGSGTGLGCDRGAQMALQHTGVKSQDAPIYTYTATFGNGRHKKGFVGSTAVLIS